MLAGKIGYFRQAFDPRSIANLALWLDASATGGFTSTSGQVTQWTDLSGNARHFTQTTANNRPTLFTSASDAQTTTPATIGGKQAFFFDGVNDRLAGNVAARNIGRNVGGVSLFAVVQLTSAAANERFVYAALTPQSNYRHGLLFNTGLTIFRLLGQRLDADSAVTRSSASGFFSTGPIYVISALWNNTAATSLAMLNGTTVIASGAHGTAGSTSDTAASQVNIGFTGFGGFWAGLIGSVLIYDRALSDAERATVRSGLAAQWGAS
jgi:hypothetical protein